MPPQGPLIRPTGELVPAVRTVLAGRNSPDNLAHNAPDFDAFRAQVHSA